MARLAFSFDIPKKIEFIEKKFERREVSYSCFEKLRLACAQALHSNFQVIKAGQSNFSKGPAAVD